MREDGSKSHGYQLNNVPNSVKDKVNNHNETKKGRKKQKDLDKAKKEIESKNLKLDWAHIGDVLLAAGIVITCTATVFFPGDDVAAWLNFLRAIGIS